jgi:16S rRNA (cytosine1402-N4)-methyltransferase
MHKPVLLEETINLLFNCPEGVYLDGTGGAGGHAFEIAQRLQSSGKLVILDLDPSAIAVLKNRFASFPNVHIAQENFSNFKNVLSQQRIEKLSGALLDLGLSSMLLEQARGFSYRLDSPLDMRFNPQSRITAHELLKSTSEIELSQILREYGEVPHANKLAKAIKRDLPHSTMELAQIISRFAPPRMKEKTLSKVFQAIRIALNSELDNLHNFLEDILDSLHPGGRLAIISYHSLEDRVSKEFFQRESRNCICSANIPQCLCGHHATFKILTPHPVRPSLAEVKSNPRARSGRLRVGERL